MANDAEVMLNMAARLGAARAEAVRLLAAAVEAGAGVWMHNLSTGARALVTHEDTLTRLLTEGWSHDAPPAPSGEASEVSAEVSAAAAAAAADDDEPDKPAKGKKA